MSIKILDCTLRDGGYINDWAFADQKAYDILHALEASGVEIVECGYLNHAKGKEKNSTLYKHIEAVKTINASKSVVMINEGDYDISLLPLAKESLIKGIRLAFHKVNIERAIATAKAIVALGYRLYFQPMVTKNYTDLEFLALVERVNGLGVFAFYIVDSFGSMQPTEFRRYMMLADHNLDTKIALGYHSHNNMQLAFSNAIAMCDFRFAREIIIDSSIYGIGRGAGNLNTELIVDYLNGSFGTSYPILPLLEVIDSYLGAMIQETPWGFSPAQYLSASLDCHPNYAKYLIDKNTNHIVGVQKVLERIPQTKKASFDKELIESLYIASLTEAKIAIYGALVLEKGKKLLLIASGKSAENAQEMLEAKTRSGDYLSVALNHIPSFGCDVYFFSNQKRFDEFCELIEPNKVVITDNIFTQLPLFAVLPFASLAFVNGVFVKNVAIVALNHFVLQGVESVEIAGLDGYRLHETNYSYHETSIILDTKEMEEENRIVAKSLNELKEKIAIDFLTPSVFYSNANLKILGVIPARYKSSRFEGKPLCMIKDIPMVKRTYLQAKQSKLLTDLVVATDSQIIEAFCQGESIPVVMTSESCATGTDRLAEVAKQKYYDLYVNIQGDEPVVDPITIDEVVEDFITHGDAYIAYNLYKVIDSTQEIQSNTIIKVIVNEKEELMYMSRLPVPFDKSGVEPTFKKQVCVYGFTKKALEVFSSREKTLNEQHEDIEILRFLDMGYRVKMKETTRDSIAVDVPSDVAKVEAYLEQKGLK